MKQLDIDNFNQKVAKKADANRQLVQDLRKRKKKIDGVFHASHYEVFEEMDCLTCANCCKTTGPLFLDSDIERLSKVLKMKPAIFIQEYLRIDEEGDHVLQSTPCAFLGHDNKCIVYEDRPKACREYPHTNRKNMHQILKLTEKNALICPAVDKIFDAIRIKLG